MLIKEIMSDKVHCVSVDVTLRELRDIFKKVHYHHLLVADGKKLLGVISDRDVLASSPYFDSKRAMSDDDLKLLDKKASSIMTDKIITVREDTLIDAAAIVLLENNISCLPVVGDANEIQGITTWKDMLKYYVYVK